MPPAPPPTSSPRARRCGFPDRANGARATQVTDDGGGPKGVTLLVSWTRGVRDRDAGDLSITCLAACKTLRVTQRYRKSFTAAASLSSTNG